MLNETLDLDLVTNFLVYAKGVQKTKKLDCEVFKRLDGSFLSQLVQEGHDDMNALKLVRELSSSLQDLSFLAKEGYKTMQEELRPQAHNPGISSLPFELIARIIKHNLDKPFGEVDRYQGHNGYDSNLYLVNSHFRGILLNLPELWTQISSEKDPRLSLERSRSHGLYVRVDSKNLVLPGVCSRGYIDHITAHASRWKTLSLDTDKTGPVDNRNRLSYYMLSRIRNVLQGREFPILEMLKVDYGDDIPIVDDFLMVPNDQDPNASLRSFFSTWKMPALRHLDASGFIPILHPISSRGLTCFRLKLGSKGGILDSSMHIGPLAKLLQSLVALEDLEFEFNAIIEIIGDEPFPIELPRLKSLSLTSDVTLCVNIVDQIFSIITAPMVEKLSLNFGTIGCAEAEFMLNAIFPNDILKWPRLKSLHCRVFAEDGGDSSFPPYDGVFSRLPRLQHLSLCAHSYLPPTTIVLHPSVVEQGGNLYPPLRSITLSYCNKFDMNFISTLLPIIESPVFEKLEIVECPVLDRKVLRMMFPEGKKLIINSD